VPPARLPFGISQEILVSSTPPPGPAPLLAWKVSTIALSVLLIAAVAFFFFFTQKITDGAQLLDSGASLAAAGSESSPDPAVRQRSMTVPPSWRMVPRALPKERRPLKPVR
jgi:hypothetical protein